MKKILISIIAILLNVAVFAQSGDWNGSGHGGYHHGSGSDPQQYQSNLTPEQRAQGSVDKLSKQVPVTDVQKDSLVKAYVSFYNDLNTYKTQGNEDVMKMLRDKFDTKIKSILGSDELYAKYQQYMAQQRQQWQHSGNYGNHEQNHDNSGDDDNKN